MNKTAAPSVSVIINCFNSDKFLRETLDSLFAQTYSDFEVIFWDNQSTDKSAKIVKSYNDARVRYFYAPKHTTLGEGRNLALAEAKGEWFAFLDCDDIWNPEKLKLQMEIVRYGEPSLGLVYTKTIYLGGPHDGKELNPEFEGRLSPEGHVLPDYLAVGNFIPLPAALIKKSAFIDVGKIPNQLKQAEDYYLFAAIAAKYSVRCVQKVLTHYRIHESNLSHKQRYESVAESLFVMNKFKNKANFSGRGYLHFLNRVSRYSFLSLYYGLIEHHPLKSTVQQLPTIGIAMLPVGTSLEVLKKINSLVRRQICTIKATQNK
jgi:glycosyltransferase involved in cell wall biosynthesis